MTTPLWSNVALQLHCDGTNGSTTFIDETGKTVTAVGDVAVNTAQSKFGGASAYFGPSGGNLSVPNSASFDVGNGDFTVEAWVYTTTTSGLGGIIGYANGWASNSNYAFQMLRNGDKWQFEIVNGTNQYGGVAAAGTVVPNVWVHVAMVRHGANLYAFADGVLLKTTDVSTLSANNPAGAVLHIGRVQGFYPWSGYIDDIRLVKGEALYTSNFAPPTGPHPDATPSVILAEMSGQLLPNGASFVEVDNPGLILAEMVGQLLPNGGSSLTVFNPGLIKAELSGMPTPNSGSRILVASFVSEDVYLKIDGEFRIVSFEIVPVTVHGQFELEGGVPVAARQSLVVDGLVRVVNDTPCGCYGE